MARRCSPGPGGAIVVHHVGLDLLGIGTESPSLNSIMRFKARVILSICKNSLHDEPERDSRMAPAMITEMAHSNHEALFPDFKSTLKVRDP